MTRSTTTAAARNAVFDTAELLEAILVCLPFKELFVVPRVCKSFKQVITSSVHIQQKMFLRSRGVDERWFLPTIKYPTIGGPLGPVSPQVTKATKEYRVTDLCPLLSREPFWTEWEIYSIVDWPVLIPAEITSLMDMEDLLCHKDASWRNILLTDPPYESASVLEMCMTIPCAQEKSIKCETSIPCGTTLGSLSDAILSARLTQGFAYSEDDDLTFHRDLTETDGTVLDICKGFEDWDGRDGLKISICTLDVLFPGAIFPTAAVKEKFGREQVSTSA